MSWLDDPATAQRARAFLRAKRDGADDVVARAAAGWSFEMLMAYLMMSEGFAREYMDVA